MVDLASRVGSRVGRLERGFVGVQARVAPLFPGGEVQDTGHAVWTMSTTPLLFANGVIRYDATDFNGECSERELDNCLAALSTYDVPWRFSAWAHLGADVLVPRLTARGMIEAGSDEAMWLDLHGVIRTTAGCDGIEIRPASVADEQRAWARIFTTVFGIPRAYSDVFERIAAETQTCGLVAYAGGRPIGCLSLAIEEGVGVVHNVGVVPSARRHGVARRLLQAAHDAASTRGVRACVAVVTRAGSGVCARLGYHPVTCVTYLMPAPPAS